jgi:hypothetical protein
MDAARPLPQTRRFVPVIHWPETRAAWLMLAFRWLVIGCQAAAIGITWPLWNLHTRPPMLPLLPLPAIDLGAPLLVALGAAAIFPTAGIAWFIGLLIYAIGIDQTRLQPGIISLTFVLWGTLDNADAKAIARAHLIALWLWAGVNKLLSPGFMDRTSVWMLTGLWSDPPTWLRDNFGYLIVLAETGTGVLALIPRARLLAGFAAFALHIGIFLDLSPLGHNWNEAVWPWNIALAFAGFALITPWKESPAAALRRCRPLARAAAVFLLIAPLGFYFGVMDAYLSHNLYSSNVPRASSTAMSPSIAWRAFNVPFPPEVRLYRQLFDLTCEPGDIMRVTDTRWWFVRQGLDRREWTCEAD